MLKKPSIQLLLGVLVTAVAMTAGVLLTPGPSSVRGDGAAPGMVRAADTAQITPTSAVLSTAAPSPIPQGTPLTLTATLTPAVAAGAVQFKDGSVSIGGPVPVRNGTASTTSTLAVGSRQLSAVFTPTDPKLYAPSTSPAVPFTVAGATATTTMLSASSTDPQPVQGSPVVLIAMVSPAAAMGTVQFRDGGTNIGRAVAVASGSAMLTTSTLGMGSRQLSAVFTPTSANLFGPSASPAVTFVISDVGATSTTLATDPTSPVREDTPVTMTATITPAKAEGTVQFRDGNTNIGAPVTVADGTARENATLGVASHQLTAVFTPTNSNLFRSSTSPSRRYVVQANPLLDTDLAVVPHKKDPPGDRGPRDGSRRRGL